MPVLQKPGFKEKTSSNVDENTTRQQKIWLQRLPRWVREVFAFPDTSNIQRIFQISEFKLEWYIKLMFSNNYIADTMFRKKADRRNNEKERNSFWSNTDDTVNNQH
jgi:hypothetical protein